MVGILEQNVPFMRVFHNNNKRPISNQTCKTPYLKGNEIHLEFYECHKVYIINPSLRGILYHMPVFTERRYQRRASRNFQNEFLNINITLMWRNITEHIWENPLHRYTDVEKQSKFCNVFWFEQFGGKNPFISTKCSAIVFN